MYYKLIDFFEDWDYESQATLKILKELTDESLKTKVTAEGRSLGYLAWHITISLGEMMNRTGLNISSPAEESDVPVSAAEIRSAFEQSSASLVNEIKNKWTDNNLSDEVDMYGSKWKNGATLTALITHQVHHRGQMTVLMRQAGLKVPGIYGPAREEWDAFGITAPR
jgi:uncharacterized damage-inducible protein DinB